MNPDKFIQQLLIAVDFKYVLGNREYASIHVGPKYGNINYIALKTFYLEDYNILVEAGQKFTWALAYSIKSGKITRKFIPKWYTDDDEDETRQARARTN